MEALKNCTLCPRSCKTDRTISTGFCGATDKLKIARASLHHWEEPCISGENGSGTVFFSGCNLRCVYCQNSDISLDGFGKEVSGNRLAEIFCQLQEMGAHNINLVSPTPYIPQIKEAIDLCKDKIKIPFVYNTGGYEKSESINSLKGYIDIYLTDLKYYSRELSKKYSHAENYFEMTLPAIKEMIRQTGAPVYSKNKIMQSGTIIRHLCLPGCRFDSQKLLELLRKNFEPDDFVLSLMSQYTPNDILLKNYPEINRKLTTFEYNFVIDTALSLGFNSAFIQNRSSADKKYTPPFDLSGV